LAALRAAVAAAAADVAAAAAAATDWMSAVLVALLAASRSLFVGSRTAVSSWAQHPGFGYPNPTPLQEQPRDALAAHVSLDENAPQVAPAQGTSQA
jgi:hypothetical protein